MTNRLKNTITSMVAVAGIGAATNASAAVQLPRGADVGYLAGNCPIGAFPQTSKAGQYNALCHIMQDSEKCLAFIKGHFSFNAGVVAVEPMSGEDTEKGRYCLDVLKRDLGL